MNKTKFHYLSTNEKTATAVQWALVKLIRHCDYRTIVKFFFSTYNLSKKFKTFLCPWITGPYNQFDGHIYEMVAKNMQITGKGKQIYFDDTI